MKIKKIILSLVMGISILLSSSPALAVTSNPLNSACHTNISAQAAAACNDNQNPIVGPNGILKKVTLILATIAGIVAIIIIIVAGFQYIISNGDTQKVASARSAIIGAAVGLVIIASAEVMITFVVSKL